MVAFYLLAAAFATGVASHAIEEQGSCQSIDDDCLDGYTSLLQETMSLSHVKHEVVESKAAVLASSLLSSTSAGEFSQHDMILWSIIAVVVLAFVVYYFLIGPSNRESVGRRSSRLEQLMVDHTSNDEIEIRGEDPLDEDTYCLAIALIVRDLHALASEKAVNKGLRYSRIAFAVGLIMFTVFLQVSILVGVKMYVTPQAVAGIRNAYEDYEKTMYNGHTYLNENGKHRGKDGYFDESKFDKVEEQGDVCNIPLSQVTFLGLVLTVWAITCMAQLKMCVENFMAVCVFTETSQSMADAISVQEDDDDDDAVDDDDSDDCDDGSPTLIISSLTLQVKALLTVFVFLPDAATTCYVLWLGSRWLVATNDFGNLLSNAVALEFILGLKQLMYYALVSDRNKRDLAHTALKPSWAQEPAGYGIYFTSMAWVVLAVIWVNYYIHNQGVLPDYKWDVAVVCTPWLAHQLDPNA